MAGIARVLSSSRRARTITAIQPPIRRRQLRLSVALPRVHTELPYVALGSGSLSSKLMKFRDVPTWELDYDAVAIRPGIAS